VVTGRSDATLNRGGVRLGTGEFYAAVEDVDEVIDSLVVHLEDRDELVLFVVLRDGGEVDDGLRDEIGRTLRTALSPRHVPDAIVAVPAIPRTLTGKKLEVPVKRILAGKASTEVVSPDALADPGSIEPFVEYASLRNA
jgi:acetoacetyl-CoA synthetase